MKKLIVSHADPERRLRAWALASAIAILVLIVAGGVVRAAGAGGACPDWPTCLGTWAPPEGGSALIDYAHRLAVALAFPLTLGAALAVRQARRSDRLAVGAAWTALGLLSVQIGLGAWVALNQPAGAPAWLSIAHQALALLALTAATAGAALAFYPQGSRPVFRTGFGRLSLAMLALMLALLVSGMVVKMAGEPQACAAWPLCAGGLRQMTPDAWLHLGHRLIVAAAAALMLALFRQAWRTQRSSAPILTATTIAAVLFFAQALLGSQLTQGFPAYLVGLHQITAVAAWAALVVEVLAVGLARRSPQDERADAAAIVGRKGLARDLLMLTKPIVVLLLLVTTYAGMVIGARAWPPAWVTFWTLLGGFMAAGGSGAINQYIDRDDDGRMQRTQKRPIPSGRLTPAEGLAFGVGIALASFYLLTAFVNFLAALLSLAGIIYYVLLYSVFLKKTTVQNIVIGGGAGAIPPLVGWAAATGSLVFPALFLFAIVFMWTPPHFWALALVRRNDYARAGVPMLPVVRGETETRWQIFIYTIELVGLSLLLPLFGLGGAIYLIGAAALGGWLLLAAWKVYRQGGNKLAWKMYRYSSMYLAFLFVALMIDRLS